MQLPVTPDDLHAKGDYVSVCMPYWNRQAELDKTVLMCEELYPELPLEFSVCDDGSPVPAKVPLDWFPAGPWAPYFTFDRLPAKKHPLNPCIPHNRSVNLSTGSIVVITTPEMEHQGPVLLEMLSLLEDKMDYVQATCVHERLGGIPLTGPESERGPTRGRLPFPPGGYSQFLTMLHRSLWEKAGGFDRDYRNGQACDDNDWCWRLYEVGARFKMARSIAIHSRPGGKRISWGMHHNASLFKCKWPPERRRALLKQRSAAILG
jgi:hypothetical protein